MPPLFQWQAAWVALPQVVAAAVAVIAMGFMWRRRQQAPGARWMVVILGAAAGWSATAALEMLADTLPAKILWSQISYIGIVGGPWGFIHFTYLFVRDGARLPRWASIVASTCALTILTVAFTQPAHHLLWADVLPVERQGLINALYVRGPFFWITVAYCYGILLGCSLLLGHHALTTDGIFRRQTWIIILATLAPLGTSLTYLLRLGPLPEIDQTAVGFVATGLLLTWAILRVGLFDLLPVASHTLFERMKDPLIVVDPVSRIVQLNRAARDLLHLSDNHIGIPLFKALSLPDPLATGLSRIQSGHQVVESAGVWWDIESTALPDPSGRTRGTMFALRDITALKSAELALQQAVARADTLAEEARAANRAKTTFLAQVSHDLRTPLHAIIGMTEIMPATLPAGQQEGVATIREAGESLLRLIDDLLDLSRIEAGHTELSDQPFLIDDVIDPVADLLTVAAQRKQLTLLTTIDPGVTGRLRGDPDRLRQVVMNIAGNAIKFTRTGRVHLRVCPVDDDALSIDIIDTGPGIAPHHLPRLFDAFHRGDPATARQAEGTGLGLAISQRLVQAMGGRITVASTPGQGTTFSIILPKPATPPAVGPAESLDQALAGRVLTLSSSTRDLAVREALARALRGLGARVLAPGESGAELTVGLDESPGPLQAISYRRVRLPFKRRTLLATLQAASARPESSTQQTTTPEPAVRRILLADDDLLSRRVSAALFARCGGEVTTTTGGYDALRLLRQETFDLVVLDGQMGDLDGWDVARRLRDGQAGDRNRDATIFALTADLSGSMAEQWHQSGVTQVLFKPLRLAELQRALHALPSRH